MSSWLFLPNPFNSEDNDDQNSSVADHTISTLFRSVAAFLAPPPTNSPSAAAATDDNGGGTVEVSSRAIAGMKHDLAEIGDRFKSSVSLLSSRFFKPKEDDPVEEEEIEMIGITEEVVDYVSTLSERPQLWTDFPISLPNDFEMSVNQREHVENIEQLVPTLGSLRQRIVEVKDTLMQQLQNKKARGEVSKHSNTQHSSLDNIKDGSLQGNNNRTITSTEAPKAAEIEVSNAEKPKLLFKNEGAVSLSDVEDDDNDLPDRRSSASLGKKALSSGESHEWVHVGGKSKASSSVEKGSDSEGSCEWLTIDDVDSDTMATP
nr:serine-rich adhesin for platelets-like [Ipomoea batatas]